LQKVIFDSSFLMAVVERPTAWFEDLVDAVGKFDPELPDCVRSELMKIAAGEGRKSRSARVALDLASRFGTFPCGKGTVDDEIVSAALTRKALVATVDAELARALKGSRVRVVSLRSGRVALS
jgi:rRNA-processing protein FCF1